MKRNIKNLIVNLFGYSLFIMGFVIFIIGIAMSVDTSSDQSKDGIPIAIASLSLLIPGIFFIVIARRGRLDEERLLSIASIVKSYRRITVADLAQRLNLSIPQTTNMLMKAVSKKLILGRFDRTTDEFFTDAAEDQRVEYRYCPACGSPLDRIYLEGDTIKCKSCGILVR